MEPNALPHRIQQEAVRTRDTSNHDTKITVPEGLLQSLSKTGDGRVHTSVLRPRKGRIETNERTVMACFHTDECRTETTIPQSFQLLMQKFCHDRDRRLIVAVAHIHA